MLGLTAADRAAVLAIGAAALVALGAVLWQQPASAVTDGRRALSADGLRWDAALDEARRIDVNTATAAELERLPHIGEVLAKRIEAHRTRDGRFRAPEELVRVKGIGPNTYQAVQPYITVE